MEVVDDGGRLRDVVCGRFTLKMKPNPTQKRGNDFANLVPMGTRASKACSVISTESVNKEG